MCSFPQASHQFCVAHIKRQILNYVSHKDKPQIAEELNEVFTLENKEMKSLLGYEQFITFVAKWEKKYPILKKYKAERNIAYFIYGLPCASAKVHIYDQLDRKTQ